LIVRDCNNQSQHNQQKYPYEPAAEKTKKQKTKSKVQIRDLKPSKDVKGGAIDTFIYFPKSK